MQEIGKHTTIYSFRHSGAIEIFKRTGSLHKLQRAMGHSSLNVSITYLRGLEVAELTTANLSVSHKLKLLELALNYTLPKLAHTYKEVDNNQKTFRVEYVGKTVDYNAEKN